MANELGQPATFVERALAAISHFRAAKKDEGRLRKVGRSCRLLAFALSVKKPRGRRVTPRPSLARQIGRPLHHQQEIVDALVVAFSTLSRRR